MRKLKVITLMVLSTALTAEAQQVPVCIKKPKEFTEHGGKRIDNYYWLNERENPDVIKYLEAENSYGDAVFGNATKKFQADLYKEILGRIKQTDQSVPYFKNGYWYITSFEEGKEYPIYSRKKGNMQANNEVLLNVNELAKGHKYYQIGGMAISPDNKILAYGVDTVSRRNYTVYFKDLSTGKLFKDVIPATTGGVTWANDNQTVFYSQKNDVTLRSENIKKHKLGTEGANDALIFHEKDEKFSVDVGKTKSEKYIIISSGSTLASEVRYIDANKPDAEFKVFQPREKEMLYDVDHYENKFYIRTNWNALNFRLMESPLNKTDKANWKEVIPNRKDIMLADMEIFKNYLVLSERGKALTHIRIIDQKTKASHYLKFDEEAYTASVNYNPEFNTTKLRFNYTSMTTPSSVYEYDMATHKKELLKRSEVLGGYDPANYITERLWAKAKDGTLIPISIVYKKGFNKDGKAPLLLYGYGSYGFSMDASFSSVRLSLLDRGFAYAIAHIRGGEEMGRQWYENGKMFKKKNTFTDFIDCAEYLISNKYTQPKHLYAQGGSAGGLLMGAVTNMRPDLWNGILAAVPFVDVVTTMLDETIPLTTGEFDEWGNPKNKASYDYMLSYSPYDNVTRKAYPNMLVTTGLHDSQVQYFEPAKWVAKLRELKTDNNKLVMYTNMAAGHGGASGRFERLKENARDYAFILNLEGIDK